ncbi:MAG: metallophosphatase family protein [Comamonadaceae bacterium]|nr:metallophosphatase family protein [Comamonadaceae bacterium]
MMIRIGHFSDLHYAGGATLAEVDRCFRFAVDEAIRRGVQCAVISGDATDHALDMHAPAVEALARNVRRLAEHCPVLLLQGTFSHEPPGTLNVFRLLGGRHPVHVSDRIEQVALLRRWRLAFLGRLAFRCAARRRHRALLLRADGEQGRRGRGRGGHRGGRRRSASSCRCCCAVSRRRMRRRGPAGVPTIGVSHGTVHGCLTEHGVPMAGFDHEFTTGALFAAGASAFLLGHIHRHQAWECDARVIAYAGSIGRLHYGEEGEKGFLVWEVGHAHARFTLVPTPARRTVELSFEGMPDLDTLRAQAATLDLEGAFVRVRWTVPEEDRHQIDRAAIDGDLRARRAGEAGGARHPRGEDARGGHLAGEHGGGEACGLGAGHAGPGAAAARVPGGAAVRHPRGDCHADPGGHRGGRDGRREGEPAAGGRSRSRGCSIRPGDPGPSSGLATTERAWTLNRPT